MRNNEILITKFLDLPENKGDKLTVPGAAEPSDHFSLVYQLQISYEHAFAEYLKKKESEAKADAAFDKFGEQVKRNVQFTQDSAKYEASRGNLVSLIEGQETTEQKLMLAQRAAEVNFQSLEKLLEKRKQTSLHGLKLEEDALELELADRMKKRLLKAIEMQKKANDDLQKKVAANKSKFQPASQAVKDKMSELMELRKKKAVAMLDKMEREEATAIQKTQVTKVLKEMK